MSIWKLVFLIIGLSISVNAKSESITGQGTWKVTLQGRDLDGNISTVEGYYDTTLDITWLADVHYSNTSGYGGDIEGYLTLQESIAWVDQLNVGGYVNWRLPTLSAENGGNFNYSSETYYNGSGDVGYNISRETDELSYMHYVTLGNKGLLDINGNSTGCTPCLKNTGYFINIGAWDFFWYDKTAYVESIDEVRAYAFTGDDGAQTVGAFQNSFTKAWAVHDGDIGVAVVPVPSAIWLFFSGLISLVGLAIRKNSY